ncbi:MAG: PhoX family phosphatase [Actinomycetota bacterium]|nr:PhoX family phosphatase [Actinomycetota bacterium]
MAFFRRASQPDPDVDVEIGSPDRPRTGDTFESVLTQRLARRSFLKGAAASGALVATGGIATGGLLGSASTTAGAAAAGAAEGDMLTFAPLPPGGGQTADRIIVPEGYKSQTLLSWGDSLKAGVPSLDADSARDGYLLTDEAVAHAADQFGYNNDAVELYPLASEDGMEHYVACVNHEYTNEDLLFPDWGNADAYGVEVDGEMEFDATAYVTANPNSARYAWAVHGIAAVEIVRDPSTNEWSYVQDSPYNRRITATTPMTMSGPAIFNDLLKTAADPVGGLEVLGTLNNCAAGDTPWGTYLSAEENVDQYFGNYDAYAESAGADPKVIEAHRRLPLPGGPSYRAWEVVDERFDVALHPTEALRHGWVVEVDPMNPTAPAVKRTALGRFKHECATTIEAENGRCVVYSGDDARFEYVWKFVTAGTVNHDDRSANKDLLDEGTLYVGRFDPDGTGEWLPVVYDENGPLGPENGFHSQSDVLIMARKAGDILGATPMDRPEDVQANPVTRKMYVTLTNNSNRTAEPELGERDGREVQLFPNESNPRHDNDWGQIVEVDEGGDQTSTSFTWEIFLMAGDPRGDGQFLTSLDDIELPLGPNDTYYAGYGDNTELAAFGAPDNIGFDGVGNIWMVTDGGQPVEQNDGCFVAPTEGPTRGFARQFLSTVVDSEVCGAEFAPNFESVFFNIQHPGDGGDLFEPTSAFPAGSKDDGDNYVPRPSLIVVNKADPAADQRIGS